MRWSRFEPLTYEFLIVGSLGIESCVKRPPRETALTVGSILARLIMWQQAIGAAEKPLPNFLGKCNSYAKRKDWHDLQTVDILLENIEVVTV